MAAIFDPLGNAVHTALHFPVLGEDVLVTGCGPIGCMAVAVAKHAGARFVVATDPNPERRALAAKLGATRTVDPRAERLADVQAELGMKEGFDVGLEMSGNPSAFRDLLANLCHGGKCAMLGIPSEEIAIDWNVVVFNMLTIQGIYGREMYETWYQMTVMLQSGLDISPVITSRLPYDQFEAGFAAMAAGGGGKVILDWSERDDRPAGPARRDAPGRRCARPVGRGVVDGGGVFQSDPPDGRYTELVRGKVVDVCLTGISARAHRPVDRPPAFRPLRAGDRPPDGRIRGC